MTGAAEGPPPETGPEEQLPRRTLLRFVLFVAIIAGAALVVRFTPLHEYFTRQRIVEHLLALRASSWAPLTLIAGYAVAAPIGLPISPLLFAGGVVFGTAMGSLYNYLGLLVGATLSFELALSLGRDFVDRIAGRRLRRIERILDRSGFWSLVGIRLVPIPFPVVNFGSALAGVSRATFTLSSALGMLPSTFLYTYFAALLFDAAQGERGGTLVRIAVVMGLMIALGLGPTLWIQWRRRQRYRNIMRQRRERG